MQKSLNRISLIVLLLIASIILVVLFAYLSLNNDKAYADGPTIIEDQTYWEYDYPWGGYTQRKADAIVLHDGDSITEAGVYVADSSVYIKTIDGNGGDVKIIVGSNQTLKVLGPCVDGEITDAFIKNCNLYIYSEGVPNSTSEGNLELGCKDSSVTYSGLDYNRTKLMDIGNLRMEGLDIKIGYTASSSSKNIQANDVKILGAKITFQKCHMYTTSSNSGSTVFNCSSVDFKKGSIVKDDAHYRIDNLFYIRDGGTFKMSSEANPTFIANNFSDAPIRAGGIEIESGSITMQNAKHCFNINGNGTSTISGGTITISDSSDGYLALSGKLNITGGTINITQSISEEKWGIRALAGLTISGSETVVNIQSGSHCIATTASNVTINDGSVNLVSNDKALYINEHLNKKGNFTLNGGTFTAQSSVDPVVVSGSISLANGYIMTAKNDSDPTVPYEIVPMNNLKVAKNIKRITPYTLDSFIWDSEETQANAKCLVEGDYLQTPAEVLTTQVEAPTCEEMGTTRYTAYFRGASDYKEHQDIAALGHDYVFSSFVFSDDGKSAEAVFVCSRDDSHSIHQTATVTSAVQVAPTCYTKGTTRYTATYETYSDTKDVQDIAMIDHNYVFSGFRWSTDYKSAKAVYVCTMNSNHIVEYDAEVTPQEAEDGSVSYKASYGDHTEQKAITIEPESEEENKVPKASSKDLIVGVSIAGGAVGLMLIVIVAYLIVNKKKV